MAASILLSRILGIIREIIIMGIFGQNHYTDAYNFAFNIPDLLFFLIAGGALSSAFIPVFSEYLHTGKEKDAWHVFSAITCIMSLGITIFITVAWIFAPQLAQIVAPGVSDPKLLELITVLSRILLPAQFAFFVGGIMFGTLYARQIFTVPGLGPNLYNFGIILGALVISLVIPIPVMLDGPIPTRSIAGLAWGALGGAFLGNVIIPLFVIRHLKAQFKFTLDTKHPGVRKVFKLMAPVVFGLSLPGVFALFVKSLSSLFGGDGLATAFTNANQLMQAPLGIFGQSLALAAFPALAQFVAQKRMDAYREQLVKTLQTVIYLSVPVAFFLLFSSHDIVKAIFERGAFTAEDTARTAPLLSAFAVGVPFWCLQPVLMRAFFAIQNTIRPVVLGTITTGVFLSLSFIAYKLKLPAYSLAAAGSVSAMVLVALMTIFIKKEVEELSFKTLFPTAAKSTFAGILSAAVFAGAFAILGPLGLGENKYLNILVLVVFGVIAAWAYYFVTKALKMPETAYLDRALKRKTSPQSQSPDSPTDSENNAPDKTDSE